MYCTQSESQVLAYPAETALQYGIASLTAQTALAQPPKQQVQPCCTPTCPEIQTPQRRARLHDKDRIRWQEAKKHALL